MFIRVVKRKLRYDVALDFKLLESYRPAPDQPPKHRFLKNWTIRQDDIWAMGEYLVGDIEYDLFTLAPDHEQKKILTQVKKALRRYQRIGPAHAY